VSHLVDSYETRKGWVHKRVPDEVEAVFGLNDHLTRYRLGIPWELLFIDKESAIQLRWNREHPYTVYLAGGANGGKSAAVVGSAKRLIEAVEIAKGALRPGGSA
jgi:hypothetical protein